jgi:hypothetical protein
MYTSIYIYTVFIKKIGVIKKRWWPVRSSVPDVFVSFLNLESKEQCFGGLAG